MTPSTPLRTGLYELSMQEAYAAPDMSGLPCSNRSFSSCGKSSALSRAEVVMRGWLTLAALIWPPMALAQPADCPTLPSKGPSIPMSVDLAGRPGVPSGTTGQAWVAVPMQAPRTDCGEPAPPEDVLRGAPGDLLRGTPAPAGR